MEFFQTAWRDGSSLNRGLTKEEYFYDQIYRNVEENVRNRTLPFFNKKADSVPVELSTGKIINDENLIALEQASSRKKYTSNVWIYGNVLEKMQHEGISLNLKKGAEPVLCLTKYANATHLNEKELYIAEGGNRSKAQFLYNYETLDERSRKAVDKYFSKVQSVSKEYAGENFSAFIGNVKNVKSGRVPGLEKLKETLRSASINASKAYSESFEKGDMGNTDLLPLINAQAKHMCQASTAARIKSDISENNENTCYSLLEKVFSESKEKGAREWKVGEALTKAMDAGTMYAKSYTSRDFNFEIRKVKEEQNIRTENLKKRPHYRNEIEY